LFRALADQLDGDQGQHVRYRIEAVNYIRRNKDMYTPFIEDDETIDQYCDDMIKDGIWGGQLEMNALATSLKFNVIVH
jgi:OTU domain-containing protein 3